MTDLVDEVPWSERVTAYDRAHFAVYIRLLDAKAAGAGSIDMAREVLGIDPSRDADRAYRLVESHLRRAEWMSAQGYKELLKKT